VGALRAVEDVHGVLLGRGRCLDLFPRGVLVGVGDLGLLAEGTDALAVPGSEEDGGDGGEDDVAVGFVSGRLWRGWRRCWR
jgi:hypothetical protein